MFRHILKITKLKSDYGVAKIKLTVESKWIKVNHDNVLYDLFPEDFN